MARRLPAALAALLALAAASGCAGSAATTAPITTSARPQATLYSLLPMSGAAQGEAASMVDAIRVAIAQAGGVAGREAITFRALDTGDDPASCARAAARAAADPRAVGVIGTFGAACTAAALPVLNRAGLGLVSPVDAAAWLTRPRSRAEARRLYPTGRRTLVRLWPSSALAPDAGAALARALGAHGVYLLADRSPDVPRLPSLVRALTRSGLLVVGEGLLGTPAAAAATVRRAHPDAIYLASSDVAALPRVWHVRAVASRGRPSPLPLILPAADYRPALLPLLGPPADGTYLTVGGLPPGELARRAGAFVSAYTDAHGAPQTYAAYAGEAAGLLLDAVARGGGDRRAVTRALMRTRAYDGLLGTWSVAHSGDIDLRRYAVLVVRDGSLRVDRVLTLP